MLNKRSQADRLELWGGLECTVNRIGDRHLDQFAKSGHLERPEDLDRVAALGVRTLRYPILWEHVAPERPEQRDWIFSDERLSRLRDLGVAPIAGLTHHGSGPAYTSLVDEGFATGLADHARAVAERYPWIDAYTPVNEPLTTARFSGLYGHWYPHGRDPKSFYTALLNQVKAVVLSMEQIRKVNPEARLVQTEDLGKTHATHQLSYQADFENMRRWITWDLLCGKVDSQHPMWEEMVRDGIDEREIGWFLEHPCPPDIVGINYYLTSERFLDHRLERYPSNVHGGNGRDEYADVEAVRVLAGGIDGVSALMRDAWERYALPIAITECHLGCTREEQVRWLLSVWRQANDARAQEIDVRAVTVWSMFGAYDWCSLLTRDENAYEPGVFDLRAPEPRPTALANAVKALSQGRRPHHSAFHDDGWWERPIRLLYEPSMVEGTAAAIPIKKKRHRRPPLLIAGANGALGREFVRQAAHRGLEYVLLTQEEMDLSKPRTIEAALDNHRPWAVINAAGYTDVDRAEEEFDRCWLDNVAGASNLANSCADRDVRYVTFSSSLVFDGTKEGPYVESDAVAPLNTYGKSKARAEAEVLWLHPEALVIRTGTLFGTKEREDFVQKVLRSLRDGQPFMAADDARISPTFVPDLVNAALDLLLDGMTGLLHLANQGSLTRHDFARMVAAEAGLPHETIEAVPHSALNLSAPRPLNTSLRSERAWVMPGISDALRRGLDGLRRFEEEGAHAVPYLC
jgi:dTDP-4-dehydrorhamnose reductase